MKSPALGSLKSVKPNVLLALLALLAAGWFGWKGFGTVLSSTTMLSGSTPESASVTVNSNLT